MARRSIDATGDIVIPGFIDTHRHTWETSIRTCAPDYTLVAYFGGDPRQVRAEVPARRRLRREPVGRARVHQRGHHDARRLVAHHEHARPRRRGDHGPPGHRHPLGVRLRLPQHVAPGLVVRAGLGRQRRAHRRRPTRAASASQYLSDDEGLITMALATRGTNFCKPDVVRYEWELAKELGINITVHVAMDRFGYTKGQLRALRDMDLLYPNTTYIHSSHLHRRGVGSWSRDSGGNVSLAPQIELQMGHGWAPAAEGRSSSASRSASARTSRRRRSSDQFTQMHAIFASERGRTHQASLGRGPRRQRRRRPTSSPSARSSAGRRSTARRWPGSPTGPARSRRARRPTS